MQICTRKEIESLVDNDLKKSESNNDSNDKKKSDIMMNMKNDLFKSLTVYANHALLGFFSQPVYLNRHEYINAILYR